MMKKILLSIGLFVVLFLSAQAAHAQGTVGPLSGRALDQSGNGINGVLIQVTPFGFCFDWPGNSTVTYTYAPPGPSRSRVGYYSLIVHTDCNLIVEGISDKYDFEPVILVYGPFENVNLIGTERQ